MFIFKFGNNEVNTIINFNTSSQLSSTTQNCSYCKCSIKYKALKYVWQGKQVVEENQVFLKQKVT